MVPRLSDAHATQPSPAAVPAHKLGFNADAAAILIALAFATLLRCNVIHHIGW